MTGAQAIRQAIGKVSQHEDLTLAEMREVMEEIMAGQASPAQIGAFLTALAMKGETTQELLAAAQVMRDKAIPVHTRRQNLVDTCGTGGDGAGTFNISTVSALVVAGAGVPVAKHGNRAASSRCGSADLLEAWGVRLDLSAADLSACLDQVGIAFLFAPQLHHAMRHAVGPRREIGIRTLFNFLGPLTNPAGTRRQVVGVSTPTLAPRLAEVLLGLGAEHALVVHGADGLDELTLTGESYVWEVNGGRVQSWTVSPPEVGLSVAPLEALRGGGMAENAALGLGILTGKDRGPRRDVVLLNTAAGLMVAGRAEDLTEGVRLARQVLGSGAGLEKLEALRRFTQEAGERGKPG